MIRVFIDGSEGTTGLRIHSRLPGRSDIELMTIDPEKRKDPAARRELLNSADIAFLCLPDAAAREAVAMVENPHTRILDTSTAHRTASGWAYGFPELTKAHRSAIVSGTRIAVPGCHASGYLAIVRPLVEAGVLSADAQLSCTSLTGYSGGGKRMIAEYEAADRPKALDAPRVYGLTQRHKHLAEMQAVSRLSGPPVFFPIVGDFYSGMLVSVPPHVGQLRAPLTAGALTELYEAHYAGAACVHVLPPAAEGMLSANALTGRDDMVLCVSGGGDRLAVHALYDNLGKGASGAAVQCMNLLLGAQETSGLLVGEAL